MHEQFLWVEDECTRHTPGHEGIADAWSKFFNEHDFHEQWASVKSTEIDGGDSFTRMMPNGIRVMLSYDGWYIYKRGAV
jgi:hypothetical protein